MFIERNVYEQQINEGAAGNGVSSDNLNVAPDLSSSSQTEELQKIIENQTSEIARLRSHSNKLLDEKKKLQQDFKAYEGLGDPDVIGNMLKQFQNNEDAKLVAEGRFEEVLKKHTERMQLEFTSRIDELTNQLSEKDKLTSKYEQLYHESEAGHAISSAAIKAGIRDTALDDALMRSRGIFTVADDGTLEARDVEGHLKTINGKPLTPDLFIEQLRENYPHYWPESKSSGARGGAGGDNTPNPFIKGSKHYNLTEQAKLRKANPELADRLAREAKEAES